MSTPKVALIIRLEAKPGKEKDVERFIRAARPMADKEEDTISWYAMKLNDNTFGIFESFESEEAKNNHLEGRIAETFNTRAGGLLVGEPVIEEVEILAVKEPKSKAMQED